MKKWPNRQRTLKERFVELIDRLFSERQIHFRTEGRVSFIRLTKGWQIAIALVLLMTGGWMTFTTTSLVRYDAIIVAKDDLIADSKRAYRTLLGEVSEYQRKFTNLTTDMKESHALMLGLAQKNASLQQGLASVSKKLKVTKSERQKIAAARENLKNKVAEIENKMRTIANQNFSLAGNLNTAEADLQKALAERNQSIYQGNRMQGQIKILESRLVEFRKSEEQAIKRLTDGTAVSIENMEKIVALSGIKVSRLLKDQDLRPKGQGGPFIALKPEHEPTKVMKAKLAKLDVQMGRMEALRNVMQKMPLAPPLISFYVTSSYGKRRDPINRRWASHYGLDLGGGFKSKVYSTAPGVVTYAGWKGKYGKLVEITHGAGMKTRYGHLNKFYVKKGQKVKFHQKIGLLGRTGRSTGAHLHYEVVFRGRAKNPMKFIKAGRNVFQK